MDVTQQQWQRVALVVVFPVRGKLGLAGQKQKCTVLCWTLKEASYADDWTIPQDHLGAFVCLFPEANLFLSWALSIFLLVRTPTVSFTGTI